MPSLLEDLLLRERAADLLGQHEHALAQRLHRKLVAARFVGREAHAPERALAKHMAHVKVG